MLKFGWLLIVMFVLMVGIFVFISSRKHLLATLLSLEFIVLGVYLLLCFVLSIVVTELYFLMVFLTFAVCEGALGLGVLVSMVRTHGSDYFQSFSILQC